MATYKKTLKQGDDYIYPRTKVDAISDDSGNSLTELFVGTDAVKQTTGTSTTDVMSQNAVTTEISSLKEDITNNSARSLYIGNLLQYLNLTDGYYVNRASGDVYYNANYACTDYISITSSTDYEIKNIRHGAWFDSTQTYISGFGDTGNDKTTITSPNNASYIRCNVNKTEVGVLTAYLIPSANSSQEVYIEKLKYDVLSSLGNDTTKAVSQKVVNDNVTTINDTLTTVDGVVKKLVNTDNLLLYAEFNENQFYSTGPSSNTNYDFLVFPVENGVTYKLHTTYDEDTLQGIRFISKEGVNLYSFCGSDYSYTADFTGNLYVTYHHGGEYSAKVSTIDIDVGSYQKPTLNDSILEQSVDIKETSALSQKGLTNNYVRKNSIYGKGFTTTTDDLSTGEQITIATVNTKTHNVISFGCKITNFTSVQIGKGTTDYDSSYITIDDTNAVVTTRLTSDVTATFTHGLTIEDYLVVNIIQNANRQANITIMSKSGSYSITNTTWYGDANAVTYAKCVDGELTECELTQSNKTIRDSLWLFGDSYFSFADNARWTYYAFADGYTNHLLNAFPGESSYADYSAWTNLKAIGQPHIAVWAAGMNDGTDSGTTPSSSWMNYVNSFIADCKTLGVTPVLCTIPSVPNINHEAKNAWIKSSGYRYIDFAKAVGASSSGVWYDGCLSSDNVHPTARGAKLLYAQVLIDLPEITFGS